MDLSNQAWQTTLQAAQNNQLNNSLYMIDHLNKQLIDRYNNQFDSYKEMLVAGQNPTLPKPANGWRLAPANEHGFVFYEIGTEPVCSERTDVPNITPVVSIGFTSDGSVSAPPGDTVPVGTIVTAPDGSRWRRESSTSPFGVMNFYVRL